MLASVMRTAITITIPLFCMLIYCYFKFLFFLSFSPWISIRICGGGGVGAPFPSCCLKEVFVIIMSIGDRLLLDNMTLRLAKLIFFSD